VHAFLKTIKIYSETSSIRIVWGNIVFYRIGIIKTHDATQSIRENRIRRQTMRRTITLLLAAAAAACVSAFAPVAAPAGISSRGRSQVSLRGAAVAPLARAAKMPSRRLQKEQLSMMAKKVAIGIVGPGLVGGALLQQLEATQATLKANGMDVSVMAVSNLKEGKPWMLCREKWSLHCSCPTPIMSSYE